jgi:hypothetical protein
MIENGIDAPLVAPDSGLTQGSSPKWRRQNLPGRGMRLGVVCCTMIG